MRVPELWRTTTFRLTTAYGAAFAVGVVLLLGLVYWRTASALTERVDAIVRAEATTLSASDPAALPGRIRQQSARGSLNAYGLFSQDGTHVAGQATHLSDRLTIDGGIADVASQDGFPFRARALATRLPWGEVLVVGRDVGQIREVRRIMMGALVWSGAIITVLGLGCAVSFGLGPLRRLRELQEASHRIMSGDFGARMPIAGRRDELDLFAGMVNAMIGEVERLLSEVKGANDSVAHDLRTPLARVRSLLHRIQVLGELPCAQQAAIEQAIEDLDLTLERFRALLRISEIEAQARRSGFRYVELDAVLRQVAELYAPLADAQGVTLSATQVKGLGVEADEKLLFEALSNLLDNAIKFSPSGGAVELALVRSPAGIAISVGDRGPGIPGDERRSVLERFRRGSAAGPVAGSGLGLSIVAAIARLHRFELRLEDNAPGLRATLDCPREATELR